MNIKLQKEYEKNDANTSMDNDDSVQDTKNDDSDKEVEKEENQKKKNNTAIVIVTVLVITVGVSLVFIVPILKRKNSQLNQI